MTESPVERRYRESMAINDVLSRAEARTSYELLEATGLDADELFTRTGMSRCADCGHLMHTDTLATLPDHQCTQRQAGRRKGERP